MDVETGSCSLPDLPENCREYRFSAVVDWIEFQILTSRPTQFRYIQGYLEDVLATTPYVEPIDPDSGKRKVTQGGATNVFRFRVYDQHANSYAATLELFARLRERFSLAESPRITGIELSFDAYCADDDRLKEKVGWMMAHISTPGVNVRQYKRRPLLDSLSSVQLDPMRTLYVNNEGDPLTYRVYLKRTDSSGEGRRKELPRNAWRARAEFTLNGSKLEEHGLSTLVDLASVDLAKLGSKYIRFANLATVDEATEGMDAFQVAGTKAVWEGRAVCAALGWNRLDRGRDGYRKHSHPASLRRPRYASMDEPANRIVTREFGKLGKRYLHVSD